MEFLRTPLVRDAAVLPGLINPGGNGGAIGGVIGGTIGAGIGSGLGPIGTIGGGVVGAQVGGAIGGALFGGNGLAPNADVIPKNLQNPTPSNSCTR
ncbi:MAG: hypothetical protein HOP07_04160 [Bacteriovoracaceae bacterium]|nr:hypothetical protein [Bacteriovoracaceae bacterium]